MVKARPLPCVPHLNLRFSRFVSPSPLHFSTCRSSLCLPSHLSPSYCSIDNNDADKGSNSVWSRPAGASFLTMRWNASSADLHNILVAVRWRRQSPNLTRLASWLEDTSKRQIQPEECMFERMGTLSACLSNMPTSIEPYVFDIILACYFFPFACRTRHHLLGSINASPTPCIDPSYPNLLRPYLSPFTSRILIFVYFCVLPGCCWCSTNTEPLFLCFQFLSYCRLG